MQKPLQALRSLQHSDSILVTHVWIIYFLAKISQFREKQAHKQEQQEKRERQRLEELQKLLQEQAAYDLERYYN